MLRCVSQKRIQIREFVADKFVVPPPFQYNATSKDISYQTLLQNKGLNKTHCGISRCSVIWGYIYFCET